MADVSNHRKTLSIGLCDDQEEFLPMGKEAVEKTVDSLSQGAVQVCVKCFADFHDLLAESQKRPFHIIFLDVEMPGQNGFQVAADLHKFCPETQIAFISSHNDYVYESLDFDLLLFVRKKVLEEDMKRAFTKYFRKTAYRWGEGKLWDGFGFGDLPLQAILYFECAKHDIRAFTTDKVYSSQGSLRTLEQDLLERGFMRIHKNYLVNLGHVKDVRSKRALMSNGLEVDLGKYHKKELLERLRIYGNNIGAGCRPDH